MPAETPGRSRSHPDAHAQSEHHRNDRTGYSPASPAPPVACPAPDTRSASFACATNAGSEPTPRSPDEVFASPPVIQPLSPKRHRHRNVLRAPASHPLQRPRRPRSSTTRPGSPAACVPAPASPASAASPPDRRSPRNTSARPISGTSTSRFCISSDSAITTGPGRPLVATSTACATSSGIRAASSICVTHFRQRLKHPPIIHLLKTLPIGLLERNLPHEKQHRRRILHGDMHPDRPMAGTRTTRHERRRRLPRELAARLRHVHRARLEPAGDQLAANRRNVIEPIEHIEITLPRHREHVLDPLRHQRLRQHLPAGPRGQRACRQPLLLALFHFQPPP